MIVVCLLLPLRAIKPRVGGQCSSLAVSSCLRAACHQLERYSHRYCGQSTLPSAKLCQTGNWCALFLRLPTAEIDHDA